MSGDGLQTLYRESRDCGVVIQFLTRENGGSLLRAAERGDPDARMVLRAAEVLIDEAERVDWACLCCEARRAEPHAFAVLLPVEGVPSMAGGFVICQRCAADRGTLETRAVAAILHYLPGLRLMPRPTHTPRVA